MEGHADGVTGPAGDVDYDAAGGAGYADFRRPDPRIAAQLHAALGDAASVVNVGAGTGSYEPGDRHVVAVEPSASMRAQRPAGAAPVVAAAAESLPFADDAFDAAMATVTVHQWRGLRRGLSELRRVSRGPVVVLAFDPAALDRLWLAEYVPDVFAAMRRRDPALDAIRNGLGGEARTEEVPVPLDCADGFLEAYYGRPERYLDPQVRRSQSVWRFAAPAHVEAGIARLAADLESGDWNRRFGHLRAQPLFHGALRLVVA